LGQSLKQINEESRNPVLKRMAMEEWYADGNKKAAGTRAMSLSMNDL
jgi:hypothetical protein